MNPGFCSDHGLTDVAPEIETFLQKRSNDVRQKKAPLPCEQCRQKCDSLSLPVNQIFTECKDTVGVFMTPLQKCAVKSTQHQDDAGR